MIKNNRIKKWHKSYVVYSSLNKILKRAFKAHIDHDKIIIINNNKN